MFAPPTGLPGSENHDRWWQSIADSNWRHPEGPLSSIKNRAQHPVVHLADADADAQAYASWAGKQLPLDQEWDRAAWGGREGYEFAWGGCAAPRRDPCRQRLWPVRPERQRPGVHLQLVRAPRLKQDRGLEH